MLRTFLATLLVVLLASPALASVNHGTFLGAGVTFRDVTETTLSAGDPEPLWTAPAGSPLVFGNQLLFFPPSFTASASGGAGDVTSSRLEIQLESTGPNSTLDKLELTEFGDTTLTGTGTAATGSSVSVSGTVTVLEDVGGPIAPVVIPFSGVFAPSDTYALPGDAGITLWSGSFTVDISSQVPGATVALLSLDNVLAADSEISSTATIQKKVVSGPVITLGVLQDCGLEIDKTCCIPPPPSPGFTDNLCDGKVVRAVFEYTGDDCSATTNDQDGSATCSGVSGAGPASLVFTKDASKHVATPSTGIEIGDLIVMDAPVEGQLRSNLRFDITGADGTQSLKIHTSCSRALRCDDQFGGMRLVELESTLGGTTVCAPPPPVQQATTCVQGGIPGGTPCDDKLVEAVFEYTGLDCASPLANPQGGQATCSGDPSDANGLVSITYTGKKPNEIKVEPASNVAVGEVVRLTATGRKDFHPNVKLLVADDDSVEQSVEFHVSCSQPLACGDEFGAFRLIGFTTKSGLVADCAGASPPPVFTQACEVPLTPPTPHCTSKIRELQLAYVGDLFGQGCSVTNDQGGSASCSGVADPGEPVDVTILTDPTRITASPSSGLQLPSISTVDLISITKFDNGEQKDLPSNLDFTVSGPGGSQDLSIHTSCSKPLNLGDLFGSFAVVGMDRADDGYVGLGGQVEFQYTVTNQGTSAVANMSVQDDIYGPVVSSESLAPGEEKTFFLTRTLFSTLTNTGVVSGDVSGDQCLPASDELTSSVLLPPQGSFDCSDAKPIDELSMTWGGLTDVCVRAWDGVVGSTLLAEVDDVAPGDVVTVAGMGGSPNDQVWEIFDVGCTTKLGESEFHISCSDPSMNGIEDCGRNEGNGKSDDSSLVNDWLLEGINGDAELDCTPEEIVVPPVGGGSCGLGFELLGIVPAVVWLRSLRRKRAA